MAITRIGNIASTIPDDSIQNAKFSNIVQSKNIIINGDMSIAQRGTSATGITGGGYWTVDRFDLAYGSIGTWTQTQSTDVPTGQGFSNSIKMDCTTADASPAANDYLYISQKVEGQNLQYLKKGTSNAESLTASFWVKSNKTGTYIFQLWDRTNDRIISKSYTILSSNTWEKKSVTFAGDTTGAFTNNNTEQLRAFWWLDTGSDFSSGTLATSWQSRVNANRAVGQVNLGDSTSNEWYVTGLQLEAGTTASDFEFLPVDVNLQRCERYFKNIVQNDASSGETHLGMAAQYTGSVAYGTFDLGYRMRTIPSVTFPSGTNYYDVNGNAAGNQINAPSTFVNVGYGSSMRGRIALTQNNTQGVSVWYRFSSSAPSTATITASSEL
jgi:hypothetical protein